MLLFTLLSSKQVPAFFVWSWLAEWNKWEDPSLPFFTRVNWYSVSGLSSGGRIQGNITMWLLFWDKTYCEKLSSSTYSNFGDWILPVVILFSSCVAKIHTHLPPAALTLLLYPVQCHGLYWRWSGGFCSELDNHSGTFSVVVNSAHFSSRLMFFGSMFKRQNLFPVTTFSQIFSNV